MPDTQSLPAAHWGPTDTWLIHTPDTQCLHLRVDRHLVYSYTWCSMSTSSALRTERHLAYSYTWCSMSASSTLGTDMYFSHTWHPVFVLDGGQTPGLYTRCSVPISVCTCGWTDTWLIHTHDAQCLPAVHWGLTCVTHTPDTQCLHLRADRDVIFTHLTPSVCTWGQTDTLFTRLTPSVCTWRQTDTLFAHLTPSVCTCRWTDRCVIYAGDTQCLCLRVDRHMAYSYTWCWMSASTVIRVDGHQLLFTFLMLNVYKKSSCSEWAFL